jgi:putative endonuclease
MASRSHTLYIGVTGDLLKRVFQHKWKEHEGFTARYNCDRLVWFERHQYVLSAIAREKELKGWSRSKKMALVESVNAAWVDLCREWETHFGIKAESREVQLLSIDDERTALMKSRP